MLMEQESLPDSNTPMPVPGDAQSPLVPMPLDTDAVPGIAHKTTDALRGPVFIPSTGKKSSGTLRAPAPPQGKRTMVHIGVAVALIFVVIGAFAAVLPTGNGQASSALTKIFNPGTDTKTSHTNDTALIAAQAATATAVTQDGYDAGNQVYAGVQSAPTTNIPAQDQGSLNRFFYGQCTYWANMRYHQLTGHWVPWLGNAYQWAYQAPAYGWKTSSVPNPNGPSIIVLAPYTQGAGSYGHVAVVETGVTNPYNGVSTSNWNWNGSWGVTTYVTFYPGSGVTFIWFPG
ncbi:hypothetical protein KSZ_52320 [Dictyobacter formicarum]|uniref:Peptidase C51 domain-containing protein n=2 Tax=Dictyobacter formicarum TaxID=2778368 RepID=A0ABQ3VQ53_9CHLR|nr:hypothetical protein KSZ_52320 [Dictyobacter formicarum]